jgi:diguanylate cyclase (GGDEF)-like protein
MSSAPGSPYKNRTLKVVSQMVKPPLSANESARLAALAEYKILDTLPETTFDDLALLASELLAAPIALVTFVDADRQWNKARMGLDDAETPREQSFCSQTILQDDVFEVSDALADERFAGNPAVACVGGIRYYAGAPLITSDGFKLGTLCVLDRVPRQITAQQREALRVLARQVVALLELRRALTNLSRSYLQLHLLAEMSRMLQICPACEETYDIIAGFGRQLFPTDCGRIFLRSRASGELERVADWGESPSRRETLQVNDCWALRRGEPHAVVTASGGLICPHLAATPLEYSLCVPLTAQGETLGALTLVGQPAAQPQPGRPAFLTESKKSLAVAMAQSVALALGNLRMRETLESQSVRDSLTGLFNRRYLEESLDRELAHATRHQLPLGLIMTDLDNFKSYNDRFGHFSGDDLLRSIADVLRGGVRAGDIACRYGGDEFAIILPGASLEVTRARAEDLRQSIKQLHRIFQQQAVEPVTLSTGVAAYPQHGSTAHDLLRLADVALYRAKAQGRDCAVVALAPAGTDLPND